MLEPGKTGRCPHCGTTVVFHGIHLNRVGIVDSVFTHYAVDKKLIDIEITFAGCPHCRKSTITSCINDDEYLIWPRAAYRAPMPDGVPDAIRNDYIEACVVLPHSPKASAALSRRCLQAILLDAGGVKKGDTLEKQIDHVLPSLPAEVYQALDAVRIIGNFAAHPAKYAVTGEIVDVEPEEAAWNLEVIELLVDHYYERPIRHQKRMDALNAKLTEAGKNPL